VFVALGASAFSLAVWAVVFGLILHLSGGQLNPWPVFACGVLVGLRVASVWRRAIEVGRGWGGRAELGASSGSA
jgi:hypothetical protein